MATLRSLAFFAIFYPLTLILSLSGIAASLAGQRQVIAVVWAWTAAHRWLAEHLLGIRSRVEGDLPHGPYLFAVKHQAMYETMEMARLAGMPAIVIKKELFDIPIFGAVTGLYGVVPVERSAGAKALRNLVAAGRALTAGGRGVIIYPEGTRVAVGETPPLRSGFAALYRALGLPVVPVAVDSGRLWAGGLAKRSGIVTFRVGEVIPPGLARKEIEARVHAAINALESNPQAGA